MAQAQVTAPREKFTLPPKRMKSRCSLGWLATEKQWAKVQLCRGCRVCQEVGAVERSGSLGLGYTTGEEVAGSPYQACGLRPMGYPQLPSLLSSLGLITLLEKKAAHRALSFHFQSLLRIPEGCLQVNSSRAVREQGCTEHALFLVPESLQALSR